MKAKKLSALIGAVLLCLSLAACTAEEESRPTAHNALSLWYMENDPAAQGLAAMAADFEATSNFTVELRGFAAEEDMVTAFESGRPDILLCANDRALSLHGQGKLKSIQPEVTPEYPSDAIFSTDGVGRAYFPLSYSIDLLLTGDGRSFESFEELCAAASEYYLQSKGSFLCADSYADVFYSLMAQKAQELQGIRSKDILSENYKYIHNLFSEMAYSRALDAQITDTASALKEKSGVCGLAKSHTLVGIDESVSIYPLPVVDGGEKICLGELSTLAVTSRDEAKLDKAAAFLAWLFTPGQMGKFAERSGCLPAAKGTEIGDKSALGKALAAVYAEYGVCTIESNAAFAGARSEFELELRKTFEMLSD